MAFPPPRATTTHSSRQQSPSDCVHGDSQNVLTEAIVVAGALCGGVVTGLAGFGTALTALGFWLYVVDPAIAAALVVICSVVGQLQSLCRVRRAVSWTLAWPFLLGTWLGLRLYGRIDDRQFRYLVLWLLLASGLVLTLSSLA